MQYLTAAQPSHLPCFPASQRTSDDYIDANVRLGLSAAGMVSFAERHAQFLRQSVGLYTVLNGLHIVQGFQPQVTELSTCADQYHQRQEDTSAGS